MYQYFQLGFVILGLYCVNYRYRTNNILNIFLSLAVCIFSTKAYFYQHKPNKHFIYELFNIRYLSEYDELIKNGDLVYNDYELINKKTDIDYIMDNPCHQATGPGPGNCGRTESSGAGLNPSNIHGKNTDANRSGSL